jgi:hypothetical protein
LYLVVYCFSFCLFPIRPLPAAGNPIAVNKYHIIFESFCFVYCSWEREVWRQDIPEISSLKIASSWLPAARTLFTALKKYRNEININFEANRRRKQITVIFQRRSRVRNFVPQGLTSTQRTYEGRSRRTRDDVMRSHYGISHIKLKLTWFILFTSYMTYIPNLLICIQWP